MHKQILLLHLSHNWQVELSYLFSVISNWPCHHLCLCHLYLTISVVIVGRIYPLAGSTWSDSDMSVLLQWFGPTAFRVCEYLCKCYSSNKDHKAQGKDWQLALASKTCFELELLKALACAYKKLAQFHLPNCKLLGVQNRATQVAKEKKLLEKETP